MGNRRSIGLGLLGLGLITVGLRGGSAPADASSSSAGRPVVLAARAVAQGQTLERADLRIDTATDSQALVAAPRSIDSVVGKAAEVNLAKGALITNSLLRLRVNAGTAMQQATVHLDPRVAPGGLATGDRVEVVGVDTAGTAQIVASSATVIDVSSGATVDVTVACSSDCALAIVGAELVTHPITLIRAAG